MRVDPPRLRTRSAYRVLLTEHVFDKLWALDITMGEFRTLLSEQAEVIEELDLGDGQVKELALNIHWLRPVHIVLVVDRRKQEERIITVYEPASDRWSDDLRRRRG